MDEADAAIFKQYMEDLDAEDAQALANGVSTTDLNAPAMGGGMGNQNQVNQDLGIRKADSAKITSLIGGDDDSYYAGPGMNPYGMGMGHNPMMGMGGP